MITLYMDNFRGFKDTYLPLKDVNFFVGENSTGKTSVMALLSILSTPRFWETFDFKTDFIDLGYFSEISAHSEEFTIGFYTDFENDESNNTIDFYPSLDEQIPNALFLSFARNEDGTAKVVKFSMWHGGREIQFRVENDTYYYSLKPTQFATSEKAFISLLLIAKNFEESNYSEIWSEDIKYVKPFSSRNFFSFLSNLKTNEKPHPQLRFSLWFLHGVSLLKRITWIAPIRSKPQRIYERIQKEFSPEGEHIPFVLKKLFESGESEKDILEHLNLFGQTSGLFGKLSLKRYGDENNAPFEIQVEIGGTSHKITNVGYGVSQVIPFVVDILTQKYTNWFLIQQPEVHLHPKAQSTVGEFIYNQASVAQKKFIIETHSDFLVDRYRLTMRKSDKKVETQVVYFEHTGNGNTIHFLPIDDQGRYPEDQPPGFTEFFINEAIAMMEV